MDKEINPHKEGYVGVTSKTKEERLLDHSKGNRKRSKVRKAIDKYDDIGVIQLHAGTVSECLEHEANYRPDQNIGWNIAKGGGLPPMMNERTAKKISNTLKDTKRSIES